MCRHRAGGFGSIADLLALENGGAQSAVFPVRANGCAANFADALLLRRCRRWRHRGAALGFTVPPLRQARGWRFLSLGTGQGLVVTPAGHRGGGNAGAIATPRPSLVGRVGHRRVLNSNAPNRGALPRRSSHTSPRPPRRRATAAAGTARLLPLRDQRRQQRRSRCVPPPAQRAEPQRLAADAISAAVTHQRCRATAVAGTLAPVPRRGHRRLRPQRAAQVEQRRAARTCRPAARAAPPGHSGGGTGRAPATPWASLSSAPIPARSAASVTRRTAVPGGEGVFG